MGILVSTYLQTPCINVSSMVVSNDHPPLHLSKKAKKNSNSMEAKREAKEREFGDENIQTLLFTAGTALLMACLKRFIMMFFTEQWRLWVFLALNVVLLAIFFTSMPSKTSNLSQETDQNQDSMKVTKRTTKPHCGAATDEHENVKVEVNKMEKLEAKKCVENVKHEAIENEHEDEDEDEEAPRLSKEELNERVEAFIATFRRQLVSDAIRGRDHYRFSKKKREINGGFVRLGREEVF